MENQVELILDGEHGVPADDLDALPRLETHRHGAGHDAADSARGESDGGGRRFEAAVSTEGAEGRQANRGPHEPQREIEEMDRARLEKVDIGIAKRELPREDGGR